VFNLGTEDIMSSDHDAATSGSTYRRPNSVLPRSRNVAGRTQGRLRLTSPTPPPRSWWRGATRRIRRITGTVFRAGVWSRIGRLTTWIGAVGVAVAAFSGLIYTAEQYRLSQQAQGLTEQAQVTTRFAKAVEELGSDKLDVRLGGIYSLERLARDSKADHPTIMEVLGAYIRGHAPMPPSVDELPTVQHCARAGLTDVPLDVQAALAVIGRRDPNVYEPHRVDLGNSCLAFVGLVDNPQLRHVFFGASDLRSAFFSHTDLTEAVFYKANLSGAIFDGAALNSSDLSGANLTGADLTDADLRGATLDGADLSDATIIHAALKGIHYDSSTKWPNGFTPPPSS
jgi:hypothetical protein